MNKKSIDMTDKTAERRGRPDNSSSGRAHWYTLFGKPLLDYCEQHNDGLSLPQALVETIGSKSARMAKRVLTDGPLQSHLIPLVESLLLETVFPEQLLDLTLPYRQERFPSRRTLERQFRYLSFLFDADHLPENGKYWQRWVDVYDWRYDRDPNQRSKTSDVPDSQLEQRGKKLGAKALICAGGWNEVPEAKESKKTLELIQSAGTAGHGQEQKALAARLQPYFDWYNACYAAMLFITVSQWQRYLFDPLVSHPGVRAIAPLELAGRAVADMEAVLTNHRAVARRLQWDTRMMRLYLEGTKMISSRPHGQANQKAGEFRSLPQQDRQVLLAGGEVFIGNAELHPKSEDAAQYHLWYDYYAYLHAQREAHDQIARALESRDSEDHYGEARPTASGDSIGAGIGALEDLLTRLDDLESGSAGLPSLRIKVLQHQRNTNFLLKTLQILLLEREISLPGELSLESRLNDWSVTQRQSNADSLLKWIAEIEAHFRS